MNRKLMFNIISEIILKSGTTRPEMYHNLTLLFDSVTPVIVGLQSSISLRRILLSVACLELHYVSALPCKRYDFGKRAIQYKMCILIFSTDLG